ncbi:MAG TPA: hypothetical protein VK209_11545 [Candidatus Sulfotelmatobacter sp.]|nr:hypothetical protein [Candidatus Sulfotelmatobacter sp.]
MEILMKEKIAVATVSGKAYFLLINELKERNISFVSFIPGQPVPATTKVVVTTEKEKPLIDYDKIVVYDEKTEPCTAINEALKILQGKEKYEKVIIGIDPGEDFGLAVIADGKVVETRNCFGIHEISKEIGNIIKTFNTSADITVKIGNGVPIYKELMQTLDSELASHITLEVVSEAGTDRPARNGSHRRGLRDIASAIRIAARNGRVYSRKSRLEETSDFLS